MTNLVAPVPNRLYGVTHAFDGSLLVREPKYLKVGIGLPKGPALYIWKQGGKWKAQFGYKDNRKVHTFDKREQAEAFYRENIAQAPNCPYPQKLGFFTFTHPVLQADGQERWEPDFDAIEAHPPMPTTVDIVFMDDEPFRGAYQMWSQTELRCTGDGLNALRLVSLARTEEERALAKEAQEAGEKRFPVPGGCYRTGCRFAGKECKPGGDLRFQLVNNIRIGATSYFHTTAESSIGQICTDLHRLRTLTGGRLAGVPVSMVIRPFMAKPEGSAKATKLYSVWLEFRATNVVALKQSLENHMLNFRALATSQPQLAAPAVRMIEAPADAQTGIESDEEESPLSAQAMTAEFYPEAGDAEDPDAATGPKPPQAKGTEALKAALGAKKPEAPRPATTDPQPEPATTTPATPSIPTFDEWPDTFDGPEAIVAGVHYRFDDAAGNYRKVEEEKPAAPEAPKPTAQRKPVFGGRRQ